VGSHRGRELAAELEQLGKASRIEYARGKYLRLRDHLQLLEQAFAAAGLAPRPGAAASRRPAKRRSPSRKRRRT
jgi:hypothetical protein